jgi:hypothetical protein
MCWLIIPIFFNETLINSYTCQHSGVNSHRFSNMYVLAPLVLLCHALPQGTTTPLMTHGARLQQHQSIAIIALC